MEKIVPEKNFLGGNVSVLEGDVFFLEADVFVLVLEAGGDFCRPLVADLKPRSPRSF